MRRLFFTLAAVVAIANLSSVKAQTSWYLTGNASGTSDFLGTTNANPLIFKTGGLERARIQPGGNLGIGTQTPQGFFSVGASSQFQVNSTGGIKSTGTITFTGLGINQIVQTNGNNELFAGSVNLGSQVSGILRVVNGGTGVTSLSGIVQGNGTSSLTAIKGVANYLPKWGTAPPYLSTSLIYDEGSMIGIGTNRPEIFFHVFQASKAGWLGRIENNGTKVSFAHSLGCGMEIIINAKPSRDAYALDIINSELPAPLFVVQNDGKIGIGTGKPTQRLSIDHNDSTGGIVLNRVSDDPIANSEIKFSKNGKQLWAIGNDFGGIGGQTFFIWDHVATKKPFIIDAAGRIGMGNIAPPEHGTYTLYVEGGIAAREVKVTAGGFPDYVFDDDYKILPLNELDSYILANRHLPDLPPAAEIEKNGGFEIGDMQIRLVKKVEEQTLYIIALQKQLDELKAQMKALISK
jgi:hypothetical protein